MTGNFAKYGDTFSAVGRYSVKKREDLFALMPTDFSCNSILEVGCANGTNLEYFSNSLRVPIKNCVGVDICNSDEKIDGLNFFHLSAESYFLKNTQNFDLILLSDVLEHIYNPWKVLASIKKILNQSGYLLISVPNFQNLNYLYAVNSGNFFYQSNGLFDETHIRFFSAKVLKQYLTDLGFKVLSEGWRKDLSLESMRNDIQNQIHENSMASLKIDNIVIEINANNIEQYFGQQALVCVTHA